MKDKLGVKVTVGRFLIYFVVLTIAAILIFGGAVTSQKLSGVPPPAGQEKLPDKDFTRAPEKPHNPTDLVLNFDQLEYYYRVPGEFTPSGKDYIGRSDDLAQRTRNATDGRDRTHAEVIGTYPKGNVSEARRAEQQAINDHGGVPNLDNKRNEIAPSKWPDFGVK